MPEFKVEVALQMPWARQGCVCTVCGGQSDYRVALWSSADYVPNYIRYACFDHVDALAVTMLAEAE